MISENAASKVSVMLEQAISRHNLPNFPTPFIGRADDITDLSQLLDNPDCRLLTLVGPGGIGKTRLAVETARCKLDTFPDGAYFVPLQPLQSGDQVVSAIIDSLPLQVTGDPQPALLDYLRQKRLLLIMDNFEHVLDSATLVSAILVAAPQVTMLVSSREILNLQGEWVRAVTGLTYPDDGSLSDNDHYSAVELFAESARRLRGDFSLETEREHVIRICQLVEGMPLGIELAAGWTTALACAEIVDEIKHDLDFLATESRNISDRHRSMQAVFDHSWRLLTAEERAIMRRFAVFRGGCGREAAEQVTGATLKVLAGLVGKSMLRHDADGGRYDMHELLRQYAQTKLEGADEMVVTLDAHCEYYAALLHRLWPSLRAARQLEAAEEISTDMNNVSIAWHHALDRKDITSLLKMPIPLADFAWMRGKQMPYIMSLYEVALSSLKYEQQVPEVRQVYGRILLATANIGTGMGLNIEKAYTMTLQSLSIAREFGDPFDIALSLQEVGWWQHHRGDYESALAIHEECYQRFLEMGRPARAMLSLRVQALCLAALGKKRSIGLAIERECIDLAAQAGTMFEMALAHFDAGNSLLLMGDYKQAKAMFEEAFATEKRIMANTNQPLYLDHLATLAVIDGNYAHAEKLIRDALNMISDHNPMRAARSLLHLADVRSLQGQHEAALQLLIESRHLWAEVDPTYTQGLLAYRRGANEDALAYFQTLLESSRTSDIGFRLHVSLYCGLALVRLGQIKSAVQHLRRGLDGLFAMESRHHYPTGIYGFAIALSQMGEKDRATELASLICYHDVTPHDFRTYARQLLSDLETEYSAADFTKLVESGRSLNLETSVKELIDLKGSHHTNQAQANLSLPEPLTEREYEILQLVATGQTNAAIAESLVVAPSTVRWHLHNLCGKLAASNRTHAIARARELNLLP